LVRWSWLYDNPAVAAISPFLFCLLLLFSAPSLRCVSLALSVSGSAPKHRRRKWRVIVNRVLLLVGSALLLGGCMPKPSIAPVPAPVVAIPARAVLVSSAVLAVQSHPLYKQAETALAAKDKARAVLLLRQLSAMPTLEPDGRAFCLQQIALLSNPKAKVVGKPVPAVIAPSKQAADCGPRALALALHSLGKETSATTLSEWAKTDAKGTTMAGLKAAAKRAGIEAEGLQVSREAVEEIAAPALAWKNQNHYVAVLETNGSGESWQATIHDPNEQNPRTLGREEFLQMCGGYVLTLRR